MFKHVSSCIAVVVLLRISTSASPSGVDSKLPNLCKEGTQQSPVNINESECHSIRNYTPLSYVDDALFTAQLLFENNKDTVIITLVNKNQKVQIRDGPLDYGVDYLLENIHFHWGATEHQGCEHTINGRRFPMEAHIVVYKSTEVDFKTALQNGRIAVVSYLFELLPSNASSNEALQDVLEAVSAVKHPGTAQADGKILAFLKDGINGGFYSYTGSLTTLPCTERVLWILLKKTIPIGLSQMEVFHQVVDDNGTELQNWRETFPLNDRVILNVGL